MLTSGEITAHPDAVSKYYMSKAPIQVAKTMKKRTKQIDRNGNIISENEFASRKDELNKKMADRLANITGRHRV